MTESSKAVCQCAGATLVVFGVLALSGDYRTAFAVPFLVLGGFLCGVSYERSRTAEKTEAQSSQL